MFTAGDKVILIDDHWPETVRHLYDQLPKLETTYIVRATRAGVDADQLIMDKRRVLKQSILLEGIQNRTNKLGVEAGFNSERFRKLDELQSINSERKSDLVTA